MKKPHYGECILFLNALPLHGLEMTDLWLAASFAFNLFEGFDGFLALGALFWFLWYRHLTVDLHPAPPLLGEQLWVDSRKDPSIRYGHPPQKLTENMDHKQRE